MDDNTKSYFEVGNDRYYFASPPSSSSSRLTYYHNKDCREIFQDDVDTYAALVIAYILIPLFLLVIAIKCLPCGVFLQQPGRRSTTQDISNLNSQRTHAQSTISILNQKIFFILVGSISILSVLGFFSIVLTYYPSCTCSSNSEENCKRVCRVVLNGFLPLGPCQVVATIGGLLFSIMYLLMGKLCHKLYQEIPTTTTSTTTTSTTTAGDGGASYIGLSTMNSDV